MSTQFMVGVGRKNITPEIGAQLYGYSPDLVSESINDDLTATAVALQCGTTAALIVSVTVCLLQTKLTTRIGELLSDKLNIPASNIYISATHTHSGPNTSGQFGWGDIDSKYCDSIFIPQIIAAAGEAFLTLMPAKLGIGTTDSYVGINRRELCKDGTVCLGQNPFGSFDKTMTVLCFADNNEKPIVNIIHYGAHGTAAGSNVEISRDWPGVMTDILEKESGTTTMFLNGAEGDVGPRLTNGKTTADITYVAKIGAVAGHDAVRAYNSIKEFRNTDLRCVTDKIRIPYAPRMPLEEAREKIAAHNGNLTNFMGQFHQYYSDVINAYENNLPDEMHLEIEQTLINIGPVILVPFTYELFSEIALRLRYLSPYAYTLSLSNTNGNRGYLPSQDQICLGGYEIDMFTTGYVQKLTDDADCHFVNENLRLMEELKCTE